MTTKKKAKKRKVKKKKTKKKATAKRRRSVKKDSKKPSWSVVTFDQIETWRERLGLSKSAMAEALHVTNSTYHNWRRGTTVPHVNQQNEILSRLQALEGKADGHTIEAGSGAFRGATTRGRGPLRPSDPQTDSAQPHADAGTRLPVGVGWESDNAVGWIVAAYIASQNEPVSAGSVVEIIGTVRNALKQ